MFESLLSFLSNFALVFILHIVGTGSFPKPLSKNEEEKQLEYLKKGDPNARKILIEHNLRLVAHIVKKYYSVTSDQDDLVSIGTIGLIKAIDTFNPDKNFKLSSYASRCIENEILMYFRNQRKTSLDVSLDEAIDTDKDGNSLTLMDVIATEDNILDEIALKINSKKLRDFLNNLPQREKQIIVMRYGLDDSNPMTQREVADVLKISRSYVSRIEKKTLNALNEKFNTNPDQ